MTQEEYFKKEDEKDKLEDTKKFIEYQEFVAEYLNGLFRERGDTDVDDIIRWLSVGGLQGNALAVTVARSVYRRYLNMVNSTPETIVEDILQYYRMLGKYFKKAGVKYER